MGFKAPIEEYRFLFNRIFDLDDLLQTGDFGDVDKEDIDFFLETIAKVAEETIAPLQRAGDRYPAQLENGVVKTSPGYKKGYEVLTESGLVGVSADMKYGGLGLPKLVQNALNEFVNGACMSLGLNPLLTQGQIEALELFASEEIKDHVIPKLLSGEWYGTMNITEPQAGSDVGGIKTVARQIDSSEYEITGQKIFISWADADFSQNVCHLVLARLSDSPPGSKGLSLFLVPKYLPDGEGHYKIRNQFQILSLEDKLGLHGSPTAVVSYDRALGKIVGLPNEGLKAMFAMMNSARLGVGSQGVGVAEASLQSAEYYSRERIQGKNRDGQSLSLSEHPDIKRMLAVMRAQVFVARAICSYCAYSLDKAKMTNDQKWIDRAGLLTPIAKYFGSETGVDVSMAGIRIHGGIGYIEETGVSQYFRDSIVTTIYEGTNGIQANDLLLRKLGKNGVTVHTLIDEIIEKISSMEPHDSIDASFVLEAANKIKEATNWLMRQSDQSSRLTGAQAYLRSIGLLLGGYFHYLASTHSDANDNKKVIALVYFKRLFPKIHALCDEVMAGCSDLDAIKFD
ncbi:MAG: acyl-CoA dehydrogenase [Rhodobacteraceae bacterium]|nr:acyl-CoA dehydrogenase [Paracoccaceae bacterium]MCY4250218.1 acyl-CoA dehydrogenase [Paracoccaceae bacterium]